MIRPARFLGIYSTTLKHLRGARAEENLNGSLPREARQALMLSWARETLDLCQVRVETTGAPITTEPSILVGNHISYLDIPVLMSQHPVVFVSKAEVVRWPVFGPALKAVGTVLVQRESSESRFAAAGAIADCIAKRKESIAVFPAGTTSLNEAKPWRAGVFRIAHEFGIPIQPFRLSFTPLRSAAYIDQDIFPFHLWQLLGNPRIDVRLEIHPPVRIQDPLNDCQKWWEWAKGSFNEPSSLPKLTPRTISV